MATPGKSVDRYTRAPLSRRSFRDITIVTLLLVFAEIVFINSGVLRADHALTVHHSVEVLLSVGALVAWLWPLHNHTAAQRAWRRWMAVGMFAFAAAIGFWLIGWALPAYRQVSGHLGAFGFIFAAVLALIAVIRHAYPRHRHTSFPEGRTRAIQILDLLIIVTSIVLFIFVTTGGDWAEATRTRDPDLLTLVLHPLAYVVLTGGIVICARFYRELRDLAVLFIALAALTYVLAGAVSARVGDMVLTGAPAWDEVWFVVPAALFFLAALAPPPPQGRLPSPLLVTAREYGTLSLPYIPLLISIVFIGGGLAAGIRLTEGQEFVFLVLMVLVIARQLVTLAENNRLLRLAEHEAMHEPLTGLANRNLFMERLEEALTHPSQPVVLIYCDMDDFKEINDTYGHVAGDLVLAETARRLRAAVSEDDTVARLGGDEFAILIQAPKRPLEQIESRLLTALQEPYVINGRPRPVSASFGLTHFEPNTPPADSDEFLSRADRAMYAAKEGGKNTVAQPPESG